MAKAKGKKNVSRNSKGKTPAKRATSKAVGGRKTSEANKKKHDGRTKSKSSSTTRNGKRNKPSAKRDNKNRSSASELAILDELLLNVLSAKRKKRRRKIKRAKDEGWYEDFLDENGDFVDDEDDY